MMRNDSKLTDEIVAATYEELIRNGLPFLQISPQMFQDANIAETFKVKKSITSSQLSLKNKNIEEFRKQIFLHCGMNLNIFKLSTQTQAAFWFMLSNCK
jgi:hypothetical protein